MSGGGREGIEDASYATLRRAMIENKVEVANGETRRVAGRTDARAVLDASISERDFQTLVIELAKRTGWQVHHQIIPYRFGRDGKPRAITEANTDPGFPDLVLIGHGMVLFRELKTERGKLSVDQERWRDLLIAAGCDWRLWRPSAWESVVSVLSRPGPG